MRLSNQVDFKPICERWSKMSGRKRNLYNQQARKDTKGIRHVVAYSRYPKTPFQYFVEKVASALNEEDQESAWKQLPRNSKTPYYELAKQEEKTLYMTCEQPLPDVRNGVVTFRQAVDFLKRQLLYQAINSEPDITPKDFEKRIPEIWEKLPSEQKKPYIDMELCEIEAIADKIEREGLNPSKEVGIEEILSLLAQQQPQQFTSKYWAFVDGVCEQEENLQFEPIELAINICQRWDGGDNPLGRIPYSMISLKHDGNIDHFTAFKEKFSILMWKIHPEYGTSQIEEQAKLFWQKMTNNEKEKFN